MVRVFLSQLQLLVALTFQPLHPAGGSPSQQPSHFAVHQHSLALQAVVDLSLYVSEQAEQIAATPPPAAAPTRRGKRGSARVPSTSRTASQAVTKTSEPPTRVIMHEPVRDGGADACPVTVCHVCLHVSACVRCVVWSCSDLRWCLCSLPIASQCSASRRTLRRSASCCPTLHRAVKYFTAATPRAFPPPLSLLWSCHPSTHSSLQHRTRAAPWK